MELQTEKLGAGLLAVSHQVTEDDGKPKPPLKVKSVKQITNMIFIVEILKKAKELNMITGTSSEDATFNIDDFLVEMAVLKTNKKLYSDLVFYFKVKNHNHKWLIRRNYDQIKKLDKNIKGFRKDTKPILPKYEQDDEGMIRKLTKYLNDLIETYKDNERSWIKIAMFLEDTDLRGAEVDKIHKTGWGSKGIGGRYKSSKIVQFFKNHLACCWRPKWFIISSEGIGYTNEFNQTEFRDILFFDNTLRVRHGEKYGGDDFSIVLYTSSRKLRIRVNNLVELLDWMEGLCDSVKASPYCKINRFTSFCPISEENYCKGYINASQYYDDVANDLERAKHEIFITDWWMSPEVYLKRPIPAKNGVPTSVEFRLDQILKRAAERGCKVFILLYREFEHALSNNSLYTQQTLMGLHPNIEVIRHPGNLIFLWSHHEKSVIIDQSVVYMGGLDLCYGRYDLDDFPLCEPLEDPDLIYFPGQDYSNVRIKDFSNVDKYEDPLIDKNTTPRMPWRDIAVCLKGPVTKDVTRHFIQYWNFAKSDLEGNNRRNFLLKKNFNEKQKADKKSAHKSKYTVKRWQEVDSEDRLESGEYQALQGEQKPLVAGDEEGQVHADNPLEFIKETLAKRDVLRAMAAEKKVTFELR